MFSGLGRRFDRSDRLVGKKKGYEKRKQKNIRLLTELAQLDLFSIKCKTECTGKNQYSAAYCCVGATRFSPDANFDFRFCFYGVVLLILNVVRYFSFFLIAHEVQLCLYTLDYNAYFFLFSFQVKSDSVIFEVSKTSELVKVIILRLSSVVVL